MDSTFITIVKTLVAEQGKEVLLNPVKSKALLADYMRGEYKKESRLLLQVLETGCQNAIATSTDLPTIKIEIAKKLQEEEYMSDSFARDAVDLLGLVLRKDKTHIHIQQTEIQKRQEEKRKKQEEERKYKAQIENQKRQEKEKKRQERIRWEQERQEEKKRKEAKRRHTKECQRDEKLREQVYYRYQEELRRKETTQRKYEHEQDAKRRGKNRVIAISIISAFFVGCGIALFVFWNSLSNFIYEYFSYNQYESENRKATIIAICAIVGGILGIRGGLAGFIAGLIVGGLLGIPVAAIISGIIMFIPIVLFVVVFYLVIHFLVKFGKMWWEENA
jgi:hypothetical protein